MQVSVVQFRPWAPSLTHCASNRGPGVGNCSGCAPSTPIAASRLLNDFRVVETHVVVECSGRTDFVAIKDLPESEHAYPIAIVAHGPDRDVWNSAWSKSARPRFK